MASKMIDPTTEALISELAAEEGIKPAELLTRLVSEEDRRRHVEKPPYLPEVRVRCFHSSCKETGIRSSAVGASEEEL